MGGVRGNGPNYKKLKITGVENAFQVVANERTYSFSHEDIMEMVKFVQKWGATVVESAKSQAQEEGLS